MTDVVGAPSRRPVGRPPRISREQIAEAAREVGLDGLTLKAVADHLDVSIAALYHHFPSKDDLLRAAAELSSRKLPLPEDTDQHWAVWLLEWARYNRDAFLQEPALLGQYLEGAIPAQAVTANLERILATLVRHGFSVRDALVAYESVSALAMGTAFGMLRQRATGTVGLLPTDDPSSPDLDDHPTLRRLAADVTRRGVPTMEDRLLLLLSGIAARSGFDPVEVRAVVRREVGRERPRGSVSRGGGRRAG